MAFVDMMGSRRPTPGTRLALPHPRLLRRGLMQEIICCGCHCPMCDQSWHNGSAGMVREQPLCSKIGRERRPKIRRPLLLLSRSVNYFFALGKEAGKGSCGRGIQASLLWTTGRLSDSKRPRIKKKEKEKKRKLTTATRDAHLFLKIYATYSEYFSARYFSASRAAMQPEPISRVSP